MNRSRISVIIPVYNGAKYIGAAIRSILRQNYSDIEIIVINDGSTDETLKALGPFSDKIILISQENKGQAVARNVGIEKSAGDIIGLLDADDLWPPNHIALLLPYLEKENYDFARGYTQYFEMENNTIVRTTEPIFLEALVGAGLYKKTLFDTVGLFDAQMRQGEDFDWTIRLTESPCRGKQITDTTLMYRRHDANLTLDKAFVARGQLQALRNKAKRQTLKNRR